MTINRYIKKINDQWFDVIVEFDAEGIGNVIDVKISDKMPEFEEEDIIYCEQ